MKKIIEKLKTVDKATIARSILLILTLANQVLAIFADFGFENEKIYCFCSAILTILVTLYTSWKNNDFTNAAQLGSEIMRSIKDGKIEMSEVQEFVEAHKGETDKLLSNEKTEE